MQIVNIFYNLAREHKSIKGFAYNKTYEQGAGNELYPLVWLDDPLYLQGYNPVSYTVNVDILDIPRDARDVVRCQTLAMRVGLSFAERIRTTRGGAGVMLQSFNALTLRDYYDNNAAGMRFTYTLQTANPVDRCADDYDPDKQFASLPGLPDFSADSADGCTIQMGGSALPDFSVADADGCAILTDTQ
jgi:hypothetical protein